MNPSDSQVTNLPSNKRIIELAIRIYQDGAIKSQTEFPYEIWCPNSEVESEVQRQGVLALDRREQIQQLQTLVHLIEGSEDEGVVVNIQQLRSRFDLGTKTPDPAAMALCTFGVQRLEFTYASMFCFALIHDLVKQHLQMTNPDKFAQIWPKATAFFVDAKGHLLLMPTAYSGDSPEPLS